uniref:Uncharacterized protein n=1 Tax=Glossina pallidipes TaxID=7398 RepID=A0A1A9ZHF7_GLOPL
MSNYFIVSLNFKQCFNNVRRPLEEMMSPIRAAVGLEFYTAIGIKGLQTGYVTVNYIIRIFILAIGSENQMGFERSDSAANVVDWIQNKEDFSLHDVKRLTFACKHLKDDGTHPVKLNPPIRSKISVCPNI